MKKNCKIIEDLLPLYLDNIVSNETKTFVEDHLKECSNCTKYLEGLTFNLKKNKIDEVNSFKKFLHKINFKIIKNSLIITLLLILIIVPTIYFIGNVKFTQDYNENIDIAIRGENKKWNFQFYSPLEGYGYATYRIIMENGKPVTLVFVTWKYTLQEYLSTKEDYHVSNAPDLDYQSIDLNNEMRVYYTKENLQEIKGALSEDLDKYIKKSTLIFKNDKITTNMKCTQNNEEKLYTFTYYNYNGQLLSSTGDNAILKHLGYKYYSDNMEFKDISLISEDAHELINKIKNYYQENKGICSIENKA